MPELPEVQALVDFLGTRLDGLAVTGSTSARSASQDLQPTAAGLIGAPVTGVTRHGKFVDIDCGGTHLIFHLARAGWLRWSDALPQTVIRPGKSPIALRVRLDDGSGFDLTEAGTRKRLAAHRQLDRRRPRHPDARPGPTLRRLHPRAPRRSLPDNGSSSRACSATRARSVASAMPTPTRSSTSRSCRPSRSPARSTTRPSPACMPRCATLSAAVAAASGKTGSGAQDAKRAGMRVHGPDRSPARVR